MATDGLGAELILSELNKYEFGVREEGCKAQRGLDLIGKALPAFKYGTDPYDSLQINKLFATIRQKALHENYFEELIKRSEDLVETNPMMGHRGVRLGITFPEISVMQIRAIFEAAAELIKEGKSPIPEIMVPVTCNEKELIFTKELAVSTLREVLEKI